MNVNVERASYRSGLIVVLCCIVAMLEGFDFQVIGVAAPQLIKELGLMPHQIGIAFSSSLIGLALGALSAGRFADRFGRKPMLISSLLVLGVFAFATGFVGNYKGLLLLRFLTGLGLGGTMPNIIAIVSEVVSRKRVTLAVAFMSCGFALGGMAVSMLAHAPAVGEARNLFFVGGVLPIILAPLLAMIVPETLGRHEQNSFRVGACQALFGEGQATSTLALWVAFALTLMQLSLLLNWLPTLVIERGFERSQAYAAIFTLNLGSVFGSLCIGWLCDRFGARWPMAVTYGAMAVALYLLSLVSSAGPLMVLSFAVGFLVLGAQFVLYGISPKVYAEANRAWGVGAAIATGRIGAILGPIVAGEMLQSGESGGEVLMLMVPLVLISGIAMLVLTTVESKRLSRVATA